MEVLNVIYRMCGIPSTNPSPWSQEDKFHLNEVCLKSFVEAFEDIDIKVFFLMDHCDEKYTKLLKNLSFLSSSEFSERGINGTMLRSYELATAMNGYVLFQECDYLYRPHIGKAYLSALEELDIVSPYDHRNFYLDSSMHSDDCKIALVNDHHFRSTERNTMTWATHTDVVRENIDTFMKHGYLDDQVWYELWLAGKRLWTPIPSFATHCVRDYLAPGINWESLWIKYQ